MSNKQLICELCGSTDSLTKHHLIPQVKCHNKYKQIKNESENILWVCDLCHRTIHAYFTENELRDSYSTKELLMSNNKFASYVNWRKKHLKFKSNSTKMSNARR